MISTYGKDKIPRQYFGREYDFFSFELFNDSPVNLILHATSDDEVVIITDLGVWDFQAYTDFIEFLKSITVTNGKFPIAMHHDFKYAKDKYGVDIKRNNYLI